MFDEESRDPFGLPFPLPSFPRPESFRRNVVPGPIPSPTLLTESVPRSDLNYGDLVLYLDRITSVYRSDDGMWIELRGFENPSACYLRGPRNENPLDRISGVTFGLITQEIPVRWLRDDSYSGLGKFDSQFSEYCWEWSLEDSNERAGDMDMGWHAARIDITTVSGVNYPARTDPVLRQWIDAVGEYPAGFIVFENDRGAVDVSFFDSVAELDEQWNAHLDEESRWNAEEENEDSEEETSDDSACRLHGIEDCTAPECAGVFRSEMIQNEIWGGTE